MTESISPLNNTLDPQTVSDVAAETGIDPAFIEKDWYAVQLLARLSAFPCERGVSLIFSGGTSLSKGYGVIKRFSEDLDFILTSPPDTSEGQRRGLRQDILSHVVADNRFKIADGSVMRGDSNRFFKAPVRYAIGFPHASLRPHLQLEMTFSESRLAPITCPIRSIIAEVANAEPETQMPCISPIETAADKLSALTWRVLVRDRAAQNDDPTLVRHLHDLAALWHDIKGNREVFIECSHLSLEKDRVRRGGEAIAALSIPERLERAIQTIAEDDQYRAEYERFVQNMSYADEDRRTSFDSALERLRQIARMVQS